MGVHQLQIQINPTWNFDGMRGSDVPVSDDLHRGRDVMAEGSDTINSGGKRGFGITI